ncbi:MAG TPA: recombinase family protein [Phenylobacterium sp.]
MSPDRPPPIRAAQYLRMSTDQQKYSLEHQAAAIAIYATGRNYEIVRSYEDAGKSGLSIDGRGGLQGLLRDVLSGAGDFSEILVFDVSRWGRYQDPDQAAHYEFICRESGVPVRYCSENFENDGELASNIMKQLKRVMAAEYSRELGVKVARAQRRIAAMGFAVGGTAPYGLRRQLVSADGEPLVILSAGQRKARTTDRIRFIWGPAEEVAAVRAVFRSYANRGTRFCDIAAQMKRKGAPPPQGGWTSGSVSRMLKSEFYLGVFVFGRTSAPLKSPRRQKPEDTWLRVQILPPMVSPKLFQLAQEQRARWRRHSDEALLNMLKTVLKEEGMLRERLLKNRPGLPTAGTFAVRFGGFNRAFRLAGYQIPPKARKWKRDALLDELRRIEALHGRVDKGLLASDPQSPCERTMIRRFGTLEAACQAAGVTYETPSKPGEGQRQHEGEGDERHDDHTPTGGVRFEPSSQAD